MEMVAMDEQRRLTGALLGSLWGLGLLMGCSARAAVPESSKNNPIVKPAKVDASPQPECVRGEPRPILAASPSGAKPSFTRRGDHEASETVTLDSRTELVVRQFGCDHYGVSYALNVKGEKGSARTPSKWLAQAARLLGRASYDSAQQGVVHHLIGELRRAAHSTYHFGDVLRMSEAETVSLSVSEGPDGAIVEVLYDFSL
jgi:hypothetical protein